MLREMSQMEKQCIDKLLSVDFKGREILLEQIENAKVHSKTFPDFYALMFEIEGNKRKFPYKCRIPIEMEVDYGGEYPAPFLLHVVNGYIAELEIYTWDNTRLTLETLDLQTAKIKINSEVIIMQEK